MEYLAKLFTLVKESNMGRSSKTKRPELSLEELKKLREELLIILPLFIFALYIFLGSFQYVFEARTVPMLIGGIAVIITGLRLFHILFPKSRIGDFKESGLAGEFDSIKEEIEKETLKGHYEERPTTAITSREEKKAIITIIGCFIAFLLFGYLFGTFLVIAGTSYYYGFRKKGPLLITLASMYLIVYVLLYKLLGAPADFGLVLKPILKSIGLI